jgi:hypothetical protein
VTENRLLRRIFEPKKTRIIRSLRKLRNEELHNLYSSPNITRVIKSRRMGWAGNVSRMEEKLNTYRVLMGKQ